MRSKIVPFLFLAALSLGARTGWTFGKNKIAYDRFDWKISKTTHFRIHHYTTEPETLRKVASMAESAYERLSRKLNFQIDTPIPIIFYRTHSDFEQTNVDVGFIPEGVGAFAEPARDRMVLPVDQPDERLQELIAHELTHVFEFHILFQGELRKALLNHPPQWFMEGLASYMANDEDPRSRMVLRDAVINGMIPRITEKGIGGYFGYRFGHAAFDYIEEQYGADGVRDFLFEFRSALGNSVEKALKRAFDITPEDFDIRFRRWLQKKYVPDIVRHGEPIDFGERIRIGDQDIDELISAVPSPSGELAAAFALTSGRVDVVVLGLKDRKVFRNLTGGRDYDSEYPIVQFLTTAPLTSRDLAWSSDGNTLAYFARRERGRVLILLNALDGSLVRSWDITADQPLAPNFSPDSRTVYFRGMVAGRSNIWKIDVETGAQSNLSGDDAYQTSPVVSKDGAWLYYSVIDGSHMKIFRLSLADPSRRERITEGEGNDEDPSLSPDGKRLFFSSSRIDGIPNVFSLDLQTGELLQWTDVATGAFLPTVTTGDAGERLVFTGYFRRTFESYVSKMREPVKIITAGTPGAAIGRADTATPAAWTPEVEIPVDPAAAKPYGSGKLFVENGEIQAGITNDQRFYSRAVIDWSDLLGNKRAQLVFDSLSSFTNYRATYFDLERRLERGITAFSSESFYYSWEDSGEGYQFKRQRIVREAGLVGIGVWPFDRYHRLEFNLGYIFRKLDVPLVAFGPSGEVLIHYDARSDNFPEAGAAFVGDTTEAREFGPWSGRRYELAGQWGYAFSGGGETIRRTASLDWREYQPVTTRSLFAFRFFAATSSGAAPEVFYFGGLDTLRGYDFRTQVGTRIVFTNFEFRFPLVDAVDLPFFSIRNIRGRVFLDMGGSWISGQTFRFWDAGDLRLKDGLSSYGWGFSWDLGGLELHWDFAQGWDFHGSHWAAGNASAGRKTTFWIGQKF